MSKQVDRFYLDKKVQNKVISEVEKPKNEKLKYFSLTK